jgi:hypothetical protein
MRQLGETSKDALVFDVYLRPKLDLLFWAFAAFFISYSKIFGESPDHRAYDDFFDSFRLSGFDSVHDSRFEIGFSLLGWFLVKFSSSSNLALYSIIAAGAVFLKGAILNRFTNNRLIFYVILVFYFSRYFPLHELTQLRAAIATSFLLVAATSWWSGNRTIAIMAAATAATFHISSLIVIPALLLQPAKRQTVFVMGVSLFFFVRFGVTFLISQLADSMALVDMYRQAGFGEIPNPFSVALILDWAMVIAGFCMWSRMTSAMRNILFLQVVGLAIFYGAIEFAVVAHRIRELFTVFWIVFLAQALSMSAMAMMAAVVFLLANLGLYSYLFIFSGRFFF